MITVSSKNMAALIRQYYQSVRPATPGVVARWNLFECCLEVGQVSVDILIIIGFFEQKALRHVYLPTAASEAPNGGEGGMLRS